MTKLTSKEYDSLIVALKYNEGQIFLSCVNEEVVNSLCEKGFFKLKGTTATATKYTLNLYKTKGDKGFQDLI